MVGMRQIRAEEVLRNDELTINNEIEYVNRWEPLVCPSSRTKNASSRVFTKYLVGCRDMNIPANIALFIMRSRQLSTPQSQYFDILERERMETYPLANLYQARDLWYQQQGRR